MYSETDFTYCPKCGGPLHQQKGNLLVCERCNFHLYINPRPTNGLIAVNSKGEILLVKRKYPPKEGYWDVAGGFIDREETVEESLRREIKEELGVKIQDLRYFTSTADRYLYQGINYHTLCFFFVATIANPQDLKPSDDITEAKFFPENSIPYSKIAFTGVEDGLKLYFSSLHQSDSPDKSK